MGKSVNIPSLSKLRKRNPSELLGARKQTKPTQDETKQPSAPFVNLAGRNIVITGTLPMVRADAEEMFSQKGVNCLPRITKSVDYLIVGSNPGKTKLEKARSYGIPIIDYDEAVRSLPLGTP